MTQMSKKPPLLNKFSPVLNSASRHLWPANYQNHACWEMVTGSASHFPQVWFHGHHTRHLNLLWRHTRLSKVGRGRWSSYLTGNSCRQPVLNSCCRYFLTSLLVYIFHSVSSTPIHSSAQKEDTGNVISKEKVGRTGVEVCVFRGGLWLRLRGRSLLNRVRARSNGSSVFVCRGGGRW